MGMRGMTAQPFPHPLAARYPTSDPLAPIDLPLPPPLPSPSFLLSPLFSPPPPAPRAERYVAGLLLHELLKAMPEAFAGHAGSVLPLAFSAKMDESAEVAAVWKELWEDGVSSEAGAVRLYTSEIVGSLVEGLGSAQWGRKKACAEAVVQLTQLGGDVLGAHASRLAAALLAESSGRLWDGKEAVLAALGALCGSNAAALDPEPGRGAVVGALLAAAGRKKTSFRTAGLKALTTALVHFKADFFAQARRGKPGFAGRGHSLPCRDVIGMFTRGPLFISPVSFSRPSPACFEVERRGAAAPRQPVGRRQGRASPPDHAHVHRNHPQGHGRGSVAGLP